MSDWTEMQKFLFWVAFFTWGMVLAVEVNNMLIAAGYGP